MLKNLNPLSGHFTFTFSTRTQILALYDQYYHRHERRDIKLLTENYTPEENGSSAEEINRRFGTERKRRLFDVMKLKFMLSVAQKTLDSLPAL